MSVRPIRSSQRYLSLNLNVCTEICPDWLLVFFELLRQQKIQGLAPGDMIEMRRRQRGGVPLAIVGPKMVEFHSKSGSAATTQLIPNNVSGAILDPVTQGAEFKG